MSQIKQEQFIQKHEPFWEHFEAWLDFLETSRRFYLKKKNRPSEPEPLEIPAAYRNICHHLALAQSRLYSPVLIERLNALVTRGHQQLYSGTHNTSFWSKIRSFYLEGLPQLVRFEWKTITAAALLFYIPFFAMILWLQFAPDMIYSVVDGNTVRSMEAMYDPSIKERLGREREADSDVYMFGFYIKHNTGIDFQIFAGGLLLGIGTLFFLLFNGVVLGAVAGHLTQLGYIQTFWGFVAGHSAFELTGMVLSGAAGFKLATAFFSPGQKPRLLALLDNSRISIQLVYGAATLTIMAAFVEAFWSSIAWMPVMIKYLVGILLWTLTISYFVFMGRNRAN